MSLMYIKMLENSEGGDKEMKIERKIVEEIGNREIRAVIRGEI